jgi:DNA-binding Lrp family transcriptional regulator
VELDTIDRQLLHALTVEPRAPFRTLGEVLGVSDQTAARRYRRLIEHAGLCIHGLVNGPRAGWADWLVRLHTTPGSADAIADALARRPDTRWVRLFSGGTEVVCVLQARTPEQRNALFLRGLPGSRRVVQISAHSTLHTFSPVAWSLVTSALSPEQLAKLHPVEVRGADGAAVTLRSEDDPLLAALARDARTSVADLAALTHWHESTVRRRIAELTRAGLLYLDLDMDDGLLGIAVRVMLWFSVEVAQLDAAGRALAEHPEVPYCAATSGATNLVASAAFRDTDHLYEYLTCRLPGLPGVRSVEIEPVIGTLKRGGWAHEASPRRSSDVAVPVA